jgi:hypothetical protein
MHSALISLLIASGVGLVAVLIVAAGLIHERIKRRKAVAAGNVNPTSRILRDLGPVEDLLVGLVSHTRELRSVLATLSSLNAPASFERLSHEIRIGRNSSTEPNIATNFVVPALFILGLAGLIRVTRDGFAITEIGREVQRRIYDTHRLSNDSVCPALSSTSYRAA